MMFGKKKCNRCREKIDGKWNFCPRCGTALKERNVNDEINRELQKMSKMMGFGKIIGLPDMDIKQGSDGSTIIKLNIGMGTKTRPQIREEIPKPKKPIKIPESIEEPETKIERKGNRQTIMIKLPGVKYEDIEIKRLESSIEIRAFIDNKCYFKLIPVPSNAAINKRFENEMLKIEVLK